MKRFSVISGFAAITAIILLIAAQPAGSGASGTDAKQAGTCTVKTADATPAKTCAAQAAVKACSANKTAKACCTDGKHAAGNAEAQCTPKDGTCCADHAQAMSAVTAPAQK